METINWTITISVEKYEALKLKAERADWYEKAYNQLVESMEEIFKS